MNTKDVKKVIELLELAKIGKQAKVDEGKPMIKGGWKKDLKMPQDIKIKYCLELIWHNNE